MFEILKILEFVWWHEALTRAGKVPTTMIWVDSRGQGRRRAQVREVSFAMKVFENPRGT